MTVEQIAQVAHEVNKAYCESLGDLSQPALEDAPDWQKESAITGVKFHLENPNASPSASHESWLKQKEEDGWKYGPEKDPDNKEHPCILPFEELPEPQKAKDYLFRQVVHSLRGFLAEPKEGSAENLQTEGGEILKEGTARLREIIELPECQPYRSKDEPRSAFDIIKDTIQKKPLEEIGGEPV